jgi:protein-S-isoprenylcysteine O-methyltransferase Ste14
MAGTVLGGVYKNAPLTESILITVTGPIYLVLFLVLLCCGRQPVLRIALVIVVTVFVSFMSGFISGANLKIVAKTLKDN